MAVTANIAPNIRSVQTQNFSFDVVFSPPMGRDVADTSFSLANVEVSGSTHISKLNFALSSFMNNTGLITVTLLENVNGSFVVSLTGAVMVGSQSEMITATAKTITYDTRTSIAVGLGNPRHHASSLDYAVEIPVTFAEDVARFTRTDCELERIAGSEIFGMETYLTGRDQDFELMLVPEPETHGVLEVNVTGAATRDVTERILEVDVTPVLVPFNARVPEIIEIEVPPAIEAGTYDILWTLDHPDVGLDADNLIYEGDIAGVDFDTNPPAVYRSRSLDVKPEIPPDPVDPDDPPTYIGDWELTRPGSNPIATQFLLLRFDMPATASGQFSVSPKPDAFRPATP